ncbi:MAG: ATP-binding cassette domain-containing protein, partial [Bacillus sp. (in: firmicutes)]
MLQLQQISKQYKVGEDEFVALNDINVSFEKSEFVSILGASGSGKTTLLNIIGGLDHYSSGDLIVDGKSTKDFKDRDWDSYRNSTIGFVFQTYNLISHLSVLDNVSIALSLSGVSAKERNRLAKQALIDVGLEQHINKKPNQLSGGQMQRVAIARALVNNPKILLADEPTGALDSHTSVQIMELMKEISKDRLVIMVTHNPELAKTYSNRIIRLKDGEIIEDSRPVVDITDGDNKHFEMKKTAMSFGTALKSSFKNLLTKKARTSIIAFAGSIGIISIALVLAISAGMTSYVSNLQEETILSFPLTISQETSTSYDQLMEMAESHRRSEASDNDIINVTMESDTTTHTNRYAEDVLGDDYTFIDYLEDNASQYAMSIMYGSGYEWKAVTENSEGSYQEVKPAGNALNMANMMTMSTSSSLFKELPANADMILSQYEVAAALEEDFTYPTEPNELVLIVDADNRLDESTLKALGYDPNQEISFEDILGQTIGIVSNDDYYQQQGEDAYFTPKAVDEGMFTSGYQARIVAVLKEKESSGTSLLNAGIGYTQALKDYMNTVEKDTNVLAVQMDNPTVNVLSSNQGAIDDAAYKAVIQQLGGDTTPTEISIYPNTFEEKQKIIDTIEDYNQLVMEKYGEDSDEYKSYSIVYTDFAENLTSSMTSIIDTITWILTAFAAISLVVSSIMIGIITYVSVVERTKEIGIMRAIGARKKDISRIFNAEAIIIGLISGIMGVGLAMLLVIPFNSYISSGMEIEGFTASLPVTQAVMLIILSVILTFVASLIPARIASKKDPVEA